MGTKRNIFFFSSALHRILWAAAKMKLFDRREFLLGDREEWSTMDQWMGRHRKRNKNAFDSFASLIHFIYLILQSRRKNKKKNVNFHRRNLYQAVEFDVFRWLFAWNVKTLLEFVLYLDLLNSQQTNRTFHCRKRKIMNYWISWRIKQWTSQTDLRIALGPFEIIDDRPNWKKTKQW